MIQRFKAEKQVVSKIGWMTVTLK